MGKTSEVEEASQAPAARGTFAPFVVKQRPVGCSSDFVRRSVGAYGMATAGQETELCDPIFEEAIERPEDPNPFL